MKHRRHAVAVTLALAAFAAPAIAQTTDSAKYEVRVDRQWSEQSHPLEFPGPGGHFAAGIGATHTRDYAMFSAGGKSTAGLELLSQTGKHDAFAKELEGAQIVKRVGEVFKYDPIRIDGGNARATFTATKEFPMVSFANMVAPSPDWYTGMASVALIKDGQWVDSQEFELVAWDSGTNSATTFHAKKIATSPNEEVRMNMAPMFVKDGRVMSIGKVTIKRIKE